MNINETLSQFKAELGKSMGEASLQKTLTTTSNLVNYDLQAPAKNLYPTITPIRNRIPRVKGNGGIATNWKAIFAANGLNPITSAAINVGWTPEGVRGQKINYSAVNKSAQYTTLSAEDSVTEEAINAAEGFEDVMSTMTMRLLQTTMVREEKAILAGNNNLDVPAPGTITLTTPTVSGSTLPATTYYVYCCALTMEGYLNTGVFGLLGNSSGALIPQSQTITSADGSTFTLNGGSSNLSSVYSTTTSAGQGLGMTVPAIPGAVAYAWFVGTTTGAANCTLQAITLIDSCLLSAPLSTGNQIANTISADCSTNTVAFNGLFYSAVTSGSGAYFNSFATGTAGTGTVMTSGGRRNVNEIDAALKSMWDNYRLSPTIILVNSQELQNIANKVMNTSSGILLTDQHDPYAITAGGQVTSYYNPFSASGIGTIIPIVLHPFVPAGTIMMWCEQLPAQYQSNQCPNVAEMHVRKEYRQTFWPEITRHRDVGVYVEEAPAIYLPAAMGILTNIGNG